MAARSMTDPEPSTPDWETLGVSGALLTRYHEDQHALLDQLATFLESALPAQTTVRRTHGLIGPKHTTSLTIELNGSRLSLERGQRGGLEARRTRVVRDVALRTDTLLLETWLDELGSALTTELERTTTGRTALSRLLQG
jgi:hypothetical protein